MIFAPKDNCYLENQKKEMILHSTELQTDLI